MAWTTLGTVAPGDVLRANSGTAAYNNVIGNLDDLRARDGLVFIKTVALSGSSTNVTDVFSSTYNNYRVVGYARSGSGSPVLGFRYWNSGGASSSDYSYQELGATGSAALASRQTSQSLSRIGQIFNASDTNFSVEIYLPFLATPTGAISQSLDAVDAIRIFHFASRHNVSTSYTGLTFLPASDTFTGSVSVYGYVK